MGICEICNSQRDVRWCEDEGLEICEHCARGLYLGYCDSCEELFRLSTLIDYYDHRYCQQCYEDLEFGDDDNVC